MDFGIIDFIDEIDLDYLTAYRDDEIPRVRINPFKHYNEVTFKKKYRFSKAFASKIVDLVKNDIWNDARGCIVDPEIQVTCALRCWGRHQGAEENKGYRNSDEEKWALDLPPPASKPQDSVWQPVGGTRFRFYVYSAFLERRNPGPRAVRIVAVSNTATRADPVVCKLWLPGNRTLMLKAKIKAIHENNCLHFSATYVLCLLEWHSVEPQETIGAKISVMATGKIFNEPTNMLTVRDTQPKSGIENELHVCVKPFQYTNYRKDWLVEWFELNRLLGASHFYVYNVKEKLSAPVYCLFNHYQKQGLATLLPFNLPIVSFDKINNHGTLAALNDCLYRAMSRAGWLLIIDLDEIVMPRRNTTLLTMLNKLNNSPAAFLFNSASFYLKWEDDSNNSLSLITARKTRRSKIPVVTIEVKEKSKYVVRPRNAKELGTNFAWELVSRGYSFSVPIEKALLRRYQVDCDFSNEYCLEESSTIDRTAHQWSDKLYKRVDSKQKELSKECPL